MRNRHKKKIVLIGAVIAGLLLVLYLSAQFWISYRLNPFVDELIKNGVINASDSLYSISYRTLTFNIATRTLELKDVNLKADSALFSKRKAIGVNVPMGLLNIHLTDLKITGIEFYEAWLSRSLEADNILLENPVVLFTLYDTITRRDTVIKQPRNFDLYKLFSAQFHSLTVQNIIVKNALFSLYARNMDTTAVVSSNGIEIEVSKLKIDSAYSANRYEVNLAEKIKIKISEAYWILPDSIYRVQFTNMKLNAKKESLSFEKIQVVPLVSKYDIGKIEGHQDDLVTIDIDSLIMKSLDMNLLLYNHSISCKQVQVQKLNLKAFRFKGAPQKKGYRPLPVEQLKTAPLMVHIDSFQLLNGKIEYAEQVPGNSFPGKIFFDSVTASIQNISNDSSSLKNESHCLVFAKGRVMGKGKLDVAFSFDQTSPVDSFTFKGKLGKLDLTLFNPLILQSANAKLESGMLDDLSFAAAGTNQSAAGEMTLQYHNLQVEMTQLEKDEKGKEHKVGKKNIKSFLANALAIVSENPRNNITRRVTLHQKRNTETYIFNYFWQTILSGVKETMLSNRMKRTLNNEKK